METTGKFEYEVLIRWHWTRDNFLRWNSGIKPTYHIYQSYSEKGIHHLVCLKCEGSMVLKLRWWRKCGCFGKFFSYRSMTEYLGVKCHGVCTFQMIPQEEKLAWLPSRFSHVQLFATLWTITRQAPLPMRFSRQEYWSRLSCPPLGVFLTQGLNLCLFCLLHWEMGSLSPEPTGKPRNQANAAECKQFVKMGKGNMDIHCDIISVFQ